MNEIHTFKINQIFLKFETLLYITDFMKKDKKTKRVFMQNFTENKFLSLFRGVQIYPNTKYRSPLCTTHRYQSIIFVLWFATFYILFIKTYKWNKNSNLIRKTGISCPIYKVKAIVYSWIFTNTLENILRLN